MLKNYVLVAFRNIQRKPFYFFINLFGLTVGIASCLIIFLYVQFELSYEEFHAKKDRIYRVNYDVTMGGNQQISPSVPDFVAPQLKRLFPEIEEATRLLPGYSSRTIRHGDKMFEESGFCWADSNFFKVLDFKILQGDLNSALTQPGSVAITNSMAKKYFGNENAIGKVLLINNKKEYEVTAVLEDAPANSYFTFDFLGSLSSVEGISEEIQWNNPNYVTFLLLHPEVSSASLALKIDKWVSPDGPSGTGNSIKLPLEPLHEVHFNTAVFNYRNTFSVTDFTYVLIFSGVGLLILIIAAINYVNLATARSATRAKEVGMRKAVGANFRQLVIQFLAESFVLLLPAILLSILIVEMLLPTVSVLFGKPLELRILTLQSITFIIAGWIILSLLAGFYPALVLSKFKPVSVLKGNQVAISGGRFTLRKALVVFQFCVSMILVITTIAVVAQLRFMQEQKLGLDKDQVLMLRGNTEILKDIKGIMNNISEIPGVEKVCAAWRSPFETVIGNGFSLKATPESNDDWNVVGAIAGDEQYLQTMGLKLIGGRNFDPQKVTTDTVINEFIVNETFLRNFNLSMDEAIGKEVVLGVVSDNGTGKIVGVVEDFHTASMHTKVEPIMLFNDPRFFSALLVRTSSQKDMKATVHALEEQWKVFSPQRPFNFTFLDDQYDAMYRTEERVGLLVTIFSSLAIFIACLGLLGLASFNAMQRSKEIGIRKVLGATTENIMLLLSNSYLKLMVVAFVIAGPVSYYLMNLWLANFAYQIQIDLWYFVIGALTVSIVAIGTVSYQSFRASVVSPVDSLKID